MKQFTYRIREDFNLHFGPAGRLAARANCYPDTTATIEVGGRKENLSRPIKVAVMGCAVNGPGEAREADIGIAGGIGEALLFRRGVPMGKVPESLAVEALVAEIKRMIEE